MGKTGEKIKRSFQYVLLAVATGVLVGILDTIFGRGLREYPKVCVNLQTDVR